MEIIIIFFFLSGTRIFVDKRLFFSIASVYKTRY